MDRSGKWSHPRILVAWLTVLAVAAGGLWFFLGPEANRDQAGREELGRDARVRTALGEAHRPDGRQRSGRHVPDRHDQLIRSPHSSGQELACPERP